jgi:hypothetical protein
MTRTCAWCKVALVIDHKAMGAPATAGSHPRPPRENDVTICDECHNASILHSGEWRVPTPDEHDELLKDKRFLKALAVSIAAAAERARNELKN